MSLDILDVVVSVGLAERNCVLSGLDSIGLAVTLVFQYQLHMPITKLTVAPSNVL